MNEITNQAEDKSDASTEDLVDLTPDLVGRTQGKRDGRQHQHASGTVHRTHGERLKRTALLCDQLLTKGIEGAAA